MKSAIERWPPNQKPLLNVCSMSSPPGVWCPGFLFKYGYPKKGFLEWDSRAFPVRLKIEALRSRKFELSVIASGN